LPSGEGCAPAISQFETTQPMVAITDSSMETSMKTPPVRSRPFNAAQMANAAVMPPIVSAIG